MTRHLTIPLWAAAAGLAAALCLGGLLGRAVFSPGDEGQPPGGRELRYKTGRFTNPLLECEVADTLSMRALRPFKREVEDLLRRKIAAGTLAEGSVYFRDLNNGMWFGINESLRYHPASMLKVPILIACLKAAEADPALLGKKVVYRDELDYTVGQMIAPSEVLAPGKSYTLWDLASRMILYSDNNAAILLFKSLGKEALNAVIQDLDIEADADDDEHMLTTHAYSGFMRVLYNASYLSQGSSEKALELLSRSQFRKGIRAGLPPGVRAATKFGEWGGGPDRSVYQCHEFGIVYHQNRPYLLGVMTRGKPGEAAFGVIREISRLVYESVDAQHRGDGPPRAAAPVRLFSE